MPPPPPPTEPPSDDCGSPQWFGDNYCDDENNNEECGWDGGDCCGDNVNTQFCSACECLDPNKGDDGIEKLSGNLGSFSISSIGNSLFVTFESDSSVTRDGFFATIHHGKTYLNIYIGAKLAGAAGALIVFWSRSTE